MDLPESLATKPNIPLHKQTTDQLKEERDFWQSKINDAPGWGASVSVAAEFRDACTSELLRREHS